MFVYICHKIIPQSAHVTRLTPKTQRTVHLFSEKRKSDGVKEGVTIHRVSV